MKIAIKQFRYTASLFFDEKWCVDFLELVGDQNHTLHAATGLRVVQGVAIIAKVSAEISRFMPGYIFSGISSLRFEKPTLMGETLMLTLERLDQKVGTPRIGMVVEKKSEVISRAEVQLFSQRFFKQHLIESEC